MTRQRKFAVGQVLAKMFHFRGQRKPWTMGYGQLIGFAYYDGGTEYARFAEGGSHPKDTRYSTGDKMWVRPLTRKETGQRRPANLSHA